MERPIFINTVNDGNIDKVGENLEHQKSISSFESHRKMYEQYAGHSLNIKPAPHGLDTFAFDLNTNTIYLNDKFYEKLGYPEVGTSFATFHEIEHFKEKMALIKEENGIRIFDNYLNKLDERISKYAGAYGVMDNCISDVRQNSSVMRRTHEGFDEVEKSLYKDVQFPDTDFTKRPLHIQLSYAILNEYRSGRDCIVDARVRKVIEGLQHTELSSGKEIDIISLMTNPDPKAVPMSKRLMIQDNYVWPKVLELLEEDLKEKKEESEKKDGKKNGGDGDDRPNDGEKGDEDRNNKPYNTKKSEDDKSNDKKDGKRGESKGKEVGELGNPNDVFKDAYTEAKKRVPNAMPINEQKESFKKWVEENGDEEKKKNKELAERLGVKVEDLKKYKDIVKSLNTINPEINESIIDDLENVIKRIISQRLKEKHNPKYPVEEGDELVDPAMWLTEVNSGNFEPKVWEDTEIKLKKDKKFGEVEITLIGDRTGSMEGMKLSEEQKAFVLFMEVLKRFNDILDDEEVNLEKPLSIKSEIYTFQADSNDGTPIKKMGKVLTEKERIETCAKINTAPGSSTPDFIPLEAISKSLDNDTLEKIKEGELKKLVIVFTDGGSDDEARVQNILNKLKEKGVIVVCIGITESGRPALKTYAPNAVLAEQVENISIVLADILKEHLEGV